MSTSQNLTVNWKNVPTRTITAGGVEFAYRELGTNNPGTPVPTLLFKAIQNGDRGRFIRAQDLFHEMYASR